MAQKFVEVIGLHNVFSTAGGTLDLTTIINDKANFNSILFMTADSTDEQYGYPENSRYIWTRNKLYPTNDGGGSSSDEKVKVRTSTVSAGFPLMAVATSSPVDGNTYTAIYDSGIVIDPSLHSVAEGSGTASGEYSHAEGIVTTTNNTGEHAEGSYNKSHSINNGDSNDTIHSVGIGYYDENEDIDVRQNAFEIIADGSVYIVNVGGYNGSDIDNASTLQEVINNIGASITTYSFETGDASGQIKVNPSNTTSYNVNVKGLGSAAYVSVDDTVTTTSLNVPNSSAVASAINTAIASAVIYKGDFNANTGDITGGGTMTSVAEKVGDMYIASTAGTFAGTEMEIGDSVIFKKKVAAGTAVTANDVTFVEKTVSVTANNPTLSFGTTSTIGTVEGVDLKVTMPNEIITSVTVSGTGNAITGITLSGTTITATKDNTFAFSDHSHGSILNNGTINASVDIDVNDSLIIRDATDGTIKASTLKFKRDETESNAEFLSSAGSWENINPLSVNGNSIISTGVGTVSIYAPTTGGTSGYVLKANGATSTPTWVTASLTDEKQKVTATTSTIYLAGVSTTSTTSVGYANANVYMSSGNLYASKFIKSGGTNKQILLGDGTTKDMGTGTATYLRNDGSWATPPGTYSHPGKTLSDTTSSGTPSHGGTFTCVDSVTRDSSGHVSGINVKTITLPGSGNTDYRVYTTATTSTVYLAGKTTSANSTASMNVNANVYMSNGGLVAGSLSVTNATISGTATVSTLSVTTINGVTVGSSPKFTDNNTTYSIKGSSPISVTTSSSGSAVTVTVSHTTSGVTAGSYGLSSAKSPGHGGTFSVPYVTVDNKGHLTAASSITITLPNSGNTDYKVYTTTSSNTIYLSGATTTSATTASLYVNSNLYMTDGTLHSSTMSTYNMNVGNSNPTGMSSLAGGFNSTASGYYSISFGQFSNATGSASCAIGTSCSATNNSNVALGYSSSATGSYAVSIGLNCAAGGQAAFAGGYYSKATAIGATAIGRSCNATGNGSGAFGYGSTASGTSAIAAGYYCTANVQGMLACGQYNATASGLIFAVGNGSSTSARSNCFSVNTAGVVTVADKVNATNGFFQTSDINKKNVIADLDLNKAYELIDKCQTIIYTLKDDKSNKEQVGMIAQEVQEFFPEIISEDEKGELSLDYSRLTVVILSVMKDLIKRISNLEGKEK